jgi:uncharacterized protein involved in outer membrane biogenesis
MSLTQQHKSHGAILSALWARVIADFRDFRLTWRGVWRWSATVLAALLVGAVITLYFLDWNQLRGPIGRWLSQHYGREVRIDGDLAVRLFTWQPKIDVAGLYVGNPAWVKTPQGANLAHGHVELRLMPLLRGKLILPIVQLDRPDLLVVRDAQGRTNWDSGAEDKTGWKLPPIRRFLVRDGHVVIDDGVRKLHFRGTVNSSEGAPAGGGAKAAFTMTGDGTLNGNRFTAAVQGGPLLHVDESRPYRFTADIHAGQTHVTADGSVTHPFHLDRYNAALTLRGPNLADLYDLTGLVLPRTAAYRVKGNLQRDGTQYRFTAIDGVLGSSDISGDLAVDVAAAVPLLTGRLASRRLAFDDLGFLFGGGKSGPAAASPYLLPDLPLHTERLSQMNAEVDYSAQAVASRDFPLRGFGTHVSLQNAVLDLKPLTFQFPQGRLSGELKIDGRKQVPLTSVDARFTDIHIESFIKSADKPLSGTLEARVKVSGRGKSVHDAASTANGQVTVAIPGGGMRHTLAEWLGVNVLDAIGLTLAGDRGDTRLRCAVASFDTRNGIMTAQQFVLDTDPVRIDGKGHVNLHDESLNLTLQGHPKSFQLFRVKVPVGISGKLAAPAITIDPKPALVQGGIGAGLALASPFAALLAFIDPGLARDANCAALLGDARDKGAPVKSQAVKTAAPIRK